MRQSINNVETIKMITKFTKLYWSQEKIYKVGKKIKKLRIYFLFSTSLTSWLKINTYLWCNFLFWTWFNGNCKNVMIEMKDFFVVVVLMVKCSENLEVHAQVRVANRTLGKKKDASRRRKAEWHSQRITSFTGRARTTNSIRCRRKDWAHKSI